MGSSLVRALLSLTAVSFWAGGAFGQVENIGNAGQIVFGVERVTGVYHDELTIQDEQTDPTTGLPTGATEESTTKSTTIGVFGLSTTPLFFGSSAAAMPRLALDFFPADGISIGGSFVFLTRSGVSEQANDPTDDDQPTVSTLIVNPRVGYAYAFDETFGIWPRLGFVYERDWAVQKSETSEQTITLQLMNIGAEVPFFISPMKHFAILIGPYIEFGVAGSIRSEREPASPASIPSDNDAKVISFGLSTAIVGYF